MAKEVEAVKVLNIDDVPYAVDAMSDVVQEMVEVFNGWNQREADVSDDLMMVRAAKNDLSRRIILQVRKEQEEAEASVENSSGDGTVEPAVAGEELRADDPIA